MKIKKIKFCLISLIILIIGSVFLLSKDQDEKTYAIMDGKLQASIDNGPTIAVKVDDVDKTEIPSKDSNVIFLKAECSNGAIGSWDYNNWMFRLSNIAKLPNTKCTLFFVTKTSTGDQKAENKMEQLLEKESESGTVEQINKDDFNNIRFVGTNPNNYVEFNGETWRIIGLMDEIKTISGKTEKLLKIIRKDPLSVKLSWDSSAYEVNGGWGVNEWSQADLMTVLNGDYFKGQKGNDKCYNSQSETKTIDCPDWTTEGIKSEISRNMIEEVVWNTGTVPVAKSGYTPVEIASLQYLYERSNYTGKICQNSGTFAGRCNDNVTRKSEWTGKVGLIYTSDYYYSTLEESLCRYTSGTDWRRYESTGICIINNWLYDSVDFQWTMTPAPTDTAAYAVFAIRTNGDIANEAAYDDYLIRPVVYLKSSVKITGGTGEEKSPYKLSY